MRILVGVTLTLVFNLAFPTPARAATPIGMLPPGTYALDDYTLGQHYSSSLVVTDVGDYKQHYETGSGVLEVWPVQSTDPATPFRINLTDLNLGGIYFEPIYDDTVVYRPYTGLGVLSPFDWGWWTMRTGQFGGGFLYTEYEVGEPEYLMVSGRPILVQKMDMVLDIGGPNMEGMIRHTHWEVPGSTTDFRDDFHGQVTVLGSQNLVHTSVAHGLLAN